MKQLNEYMMQASDFHSVNEYLSTKVKFKETVFPKTQLLDDIINFLETNGFEHLDIKSSIPENIVDEFKKLCINSPGYFVTEIATYDSHKVYDIYFFKGGTITENTNPVISITASDTEIDLSGNFYYGRFIWYVYSNQQAAENFDNSDKFLKKISKILNEKVK